jgi:hypothetical protein
MTVAIGLQILHQLNFHCRENSEAIDAEPPQIS